MVARSGLSDGDLACGLLPGFDISYGQEINSLRYLGNRYRKAVLLVFFRYFAAVHHLSCRIGKLHL
jgi:hypothetical protein